MKDDRRQVILELIREHAVETQEELLLLLKEKGFSATQATISRDIRALRLIKKRNEDDKICYALAGSSGSGGVKFYAMFAEVGKTVKSAGNIVVIKCESGMANAICASLDGLEWEGVIGTLAGDDTIFCVMETEDEALLLKEKLIRLI